MAKTVRRSGGKGAFVVVAGPDGVGKTTLADAVLRTWEGPSSYIHFIPHPAWRLEASDLHAPPTQKHTRPGSVAGGIIRLARNLARAWLSYLLAIRPAVRRGALVVGDRWLYGYVAQPRALRFEGPEWLARLAIRLAPRPDLVLVLDAPVDVIRSRKQELPADEVEAELRIWPTVTRDLRVLDARRSPEDLASEVRRALGFGGRFVRYPPLGGNVIVPSRPRASALAGTAMYAPSRPLTIAAHRALRGLIRVGAAAWLPRVRLRGCGVPVDLWFAVIETLDGLGLSADTVAAHTRAQESRTGFSLMVLDGARVRAFVRAGDARSIAREIEILQAVHAAAPSAFRYPVVLGSGSVGDLSYVVTTPVLEGIHLPPVDPPLAEIISDIQAALKALARPDDVAGHWVPIHGDFTPWNLRASGGGLALIDWEYAGWGPPDADEVLYVESARAVGQRLPRRRWSREAVEFWLGRDVAGPQVRRALEGALLADRRTPRGGD